MRSEAALRSATTPRLIGANHAGFLADHQLFTEAEFAADPMVAQFITSNLALAPAPSNLNPGAPEPSTWALLVLGFGAAGAALRRRVRMAS
jgi:hypothetical protein